MEHCIVYFSTWSAPFREEDLITTLEQSRQNNVVDGITSATLYVRGNIIQVLEGRKEAVEALYERIQQDDRHTNITKVLSRPIQERLFEGCALGYETITISQLEEIRRVVDLPTSTEAINKANEPIILKLIQVFYQGNHYN